jgi:hypothetical protein
MQKTIELFDQNITIVQSILSDLSVLRGAPQLKIMLLAAVGTSDNSTGYPGSLV